MKRPLSSLAAAVLAFSLSLAAGAAPGANYQGLWYNAPAESEAGWGINFAHQGDIIFATWFTYDAQAKPWWLIAELHRSADGVYAGPVSTVAGPLFNSAPFGPAPVETVVGSMTVTFGDAQHATLAYTVNGESQSKSIVPQAFGPLPVCTWGAQPDLSLATNYTDLWWNPAESGWGVNFSHQGDIVFATWFTYDGQGKPWWLIAELHKTAAQVYAGPVSTVTGPPFDASPWDKSQVAEKVVGSATVTFAHGNAATFAATVNGIAQEKKVVRQVFATPGTVCAAPAPVTGTAEGMWVGTTSLSQTVRAIVLDDGTYYILYTDRFGYDDAGVFQGSSGATGGTFTSTDGRSYTLPSTQETGEKSVAAAVGGTYMPRNSLQLTISAAGTQRTLTASYDTGYDHPASLAAAAGTYAGMSGHVGGYQDATFTIDASGNLRGQNPVCTYAGRITPRGSVNVFDLTVAAVRADRPCIFGAGPVSGIMYYDEAKQKIRGFAPYNGRSDLYFLIGTKQ